MNSHCRPRYVCLKRLFRPLPLKADTESKTGVLLVTVLFAIVIGQLAVVTSEQVVAIVQATCSQSELDLLERATDKTSRECEYDNWLDALGKRIAAVLHLAVAIVLAIASAVGYYNSRHVPKLKITYCNLPLLQTLLDVTMVIVYYLLVDFIESPARAADARPEAILVSISFALYALWDFVHYRIEKDEYSQVALRKVPKDCVDYGYRRGVTLGFFVAVLLVTGIYYLLFAVNVLVGKGPTVVIDLVLLALLILYRAFKSLGDKELYYRGKERPGEQERQGHPDKNRPKQQTKITLDELKKMLPELDEFTLKMIKKIGSQKSCCGVPITDFSECAAASGMLWAIAAAHQKARRHEEQAYFVVSMTCDCSTTSKSPCCKSPCCKSDDEPETNKDESPRNGSKQCDWKCRVKLTTFGQFVYEICKKDEQVSAEKCG